jgi:hypothetical protein
MNNPLSRDMRAAGAYLWPDQQSRRRLDRIPYHPVLQRFPSHLQVPITWTAWNRLTLAPRLASGFGRRLDRRKCGRDTSLGRKAPQIDLSIGLCSEALAEPSDTGGQQLPRLGEPGATVFGFECVSPVHPPVVDLPTQTRDRESRQPPDSVPPRSAQEFRCGR